MTTRGLTPQERGTRLAIGGGVLVAWPLLVAATTSGGNAVMLIVAVLGVALIAVGLLLRYR